MTQHDPHRWESHHQESAHRAPPARGVRPLSVDVRRDDPVPRASSVNTIRGVRQMLFYEALARERIREAEEEARRARIVRRLVVRRRWAWLARYAAERAERARLTA